MTAPLASRWGRERCARLVDKLLLLSTDPENIEAYRWQLEAVRRHVSDLPPDAPESAHLAGVVGTIPADGRMRPASGRTSLRTHTSWNMTRAWRRASRS